MADDDEIKDLEIHAVIAFDGSTYNSLNYHPNGVHIVYPMGNKVCIQNWKTKEMSFLSGHSNLISTVDISPKGKYIGSGQINQIGFKATVILWDFSARTIIASHELHKVRVEALIFSSDESLTISLGGRDCGQIIIFHNELKIVCHTLTASKVTTGDAIALAALHKRPNTFVSAGDGNIRFWNINPSNKAASVIDVSLGKLKRYVLSIALSKNDNFGYCGTTSGDVIKLSLAYSSDPNDPTPTIIPSMTGCYAKCGFWEKNAPRPKIILYSLGVRCIIILENGHLIIGAGDGTIDLVEELSKVPLPKTKLFTPTSHLFKSIKCKKLKGSITSLQLLESNTKIKKRILMIGLKSNEIYTMDLQTFQLNLVITCHNSAVNEITFPHGISEVFATAGNGDIRVWSLKTCQELLRIQVAHFTCSSVLFTNDGKSIVSGWDDRCIRSFTPLTGQLKYCIENSHSKGTSALAITTDGKTLISGGCEGQVRVWTITPQKQTLKAVLKEHKCRVSAIRVNNINTEVVSAGADGSCIIWDIINLCRRQIFFSNTVFTSICYEPHGCQILTAGTDRRIGYWEAGSGTLVRELEASRTAAVNTIHIDRTGDLFVSGGNDQILKLWKYQEGIYTHVGNGHAGAITSACFSPDRRYIVSASTAGCIFIWKCPAEYVLGKLSMPNSARSQQSFDRLSIKSTPKDNENISTINTARSSIIASCLCQQNEKKNDVDSNKSSMQKMIYTQPIANKDDF